MLQNSNLDNILDKKDLYFFASVWALTYAECTNEDVYLPVYDSREELLRRVERRLVAGGSWCNAVLAILEEDIQGIEFNYGISETDIIINSRNTQIFLLCRAIRGILRELEVVLKGVDREIKTKVFQDGSLVNLGPYFRSWLKYVNLIDPDFRLGGEDGQGFILKEILHVADLRKLGDLWLKKVVRILDLEGAKILVPNPNQVLSKIPSETTTLSAMSISMRVGCLVDLLKIHASRGIFKSLSKSFDLLASLDEAKDLVFSSYQSFSNNLETSLNGVAVGGLESEISFNKKTDGFRFLFAGVSKAVDSLSRAVYDKELIVKEIIDNSKNFIDLSKYVEISDFLKERDFVTKP